MDILHTDENSKLRIVRLWQEHTCYSSQETLAKMTPGSIELVQLTDSEDDQGHNESASRVYTSQEMDALTEAWTAFKADLAAREEREKARQAEVLAEALRLAREIEEIEINQQYDQRWDVQISAIKWSSYRYAYTPDELLSQVKQAVEAWDEHLSRLNGGKQENWNGWNASRIPEHVALLNKYAHRLNSSASSEPADAQTEEEAPF